MTTTHASSRYRISHRTHYKYSAAVAICQNQLRMMPRRFNSRMASLDCHQVEIIIEPQPTVSKEYLDYFGNRVLSFAIESLHRELTVSVLSEVTVHQRGSVSALDSLPWQTVVQTLADGGDTSWLSAQEYLYDSPRITRRSQFADYAKVSFTDGLPMLEAIADLTARIHADFKYDSSATDVHTTTEEAFGLRAGVCQDFAHVQIACLRSIGVPARYVSGYLRTEPPEGHPRMTGADESHAWVSVYAGAELGWIDFDPTNDCPTDTNHVPICIGRDYNEVSPMRGVAMGGGAAALSVSVDVLPVSEIDHEK
ncbi:MAG: transglutaminase domain-containing protein [Rubripirellula sp.]